MGAYRTSLSFSSVDASLWKRQLLERRVLLHAQEEPSRRRRSNERGRFDPTSPDCFLVSSHQLAPVLSSQWVCSASIRDEKRGMDSRPPRLHSTRMRVANINIPQTIYPQGSFSDRTGAQLMTHGSSLGRAFAIAFLLADLFRLFRWRFCTASKGSVVRNTISPPFALALYPRFAGGFFVETSF